MSQFHGFALDGFALTETDEFGCQWTVEEVQGWYTGGNVRTSPEPRMQQSGDWRGIGFRAGRVITARGKVFCPDSTAMELASRRLSAVLSSGGFGPLIGESPAGTLSSSVQLDDTPLFDPLTDRAASWQVTVGSDDPLLYGPSLFAQTTTTAAVAGAGRVWPRVWPRDWGVPPGVTPGSIFCPNDGTASYHPLLRVDGPCTNPVVTVQETGDQVRYYGTLAAGAHLDINWGEVRRVSIGDNPVSVRNNTTIVGNALAIPVGGGSLTFSADASSAGATLSAWHFQGAWS